jgi:hypothetical protein
MVASHLTELPEETGMWRKLNLRAPIFQTITIKYGESIRLAVKGS